MNTQLNSKIASITIFDCQKWNFDCHFFLLKFDTLSFGHLSTFLILVFCIVLAYIITFRNNYNIMNLKRSLLA